MCMFPGSLISSGSRELRHRIQAPEYSFPHESGTAGRSRETSLPGLQNKDFEVDPGRNVGSILVLIFQAFFHNSQMNQVQHTAPVHVCSSEMAWAVSFSVFFHKLHLFNPVLYEFQLYIQGIGHKMAVRVFDSHLPDILQGKSRYFSSRICCSLAKVRVSIKSCAGLGYKRGFRISCWS